MLGIGSSLVLGIGGVGSLDKLLLNRKAFAIDSVVELLLNNPSPILFTKEGWKQLHRNMMVVILYVIRLVNL